MSETKKRKEETKWIRRRRKRRRRRRRRRRRIDRLCVRIGPDGERLDMEINGRNNTQIIRLI